MNLTGKIIGRKCFVIVNKKVCEGTIRGGNIAVSEFGRAIQSFVVNVSMEGDRITTDIVFDQDEMYETKEEAEESIKEKTIEHVNGLIECSCNNLLYAADALQQLVEEGYMFGRDIDSMVNQIAKLLLKVKQYKINL